MGDDELLARLGVTPADRLGGGGEAQVYAVDAATVVRVPRAATTDGVAAARNEFQAELAASAHLVDWSVAEVLDQRWLGDRLVTWERRLPGVDGIEALGRIDDRATRDAVVWSMLDATAQIGRLRVERPWCGQLLHHEPVRAATTQAWLEAAFEANLAVTGDFDHVDAADLLDPMPLDGPPALVHFDAFPGNAMVDGTTCTAIIDFGPLCGIADARLDPLLFVVYLDTEIAITTNDADRAAGRAWLQNHGLDHWYEPARRFAAGFWAGVVEDQRLHRWVRSILA